MMHRWSFKRMPIFFQHDSKDCGVVCLQAIMAYYGLNMQLETIRDSAFLSNTGTNLLDLKSAAIHFRFKTNCYELSIDSLIETFNGPCILHWNQNHYIVLYKIRKRKNNFFSIY